MYQDDVRIDRDTINVTREGVRFSGLRIEALRNDVNLISIRLVYQNGYAEDFQANRDLRAGAPALPIELNGERSYLKKIELVYRARPNFQGRAVVRVYGEARPSRGDRGHFADRRGTNDDRGFAEIESQTIYRHARDATIFDVGRREGRFASLRFQAKDGDVHIQSVRIVFGNGETQNVSVEDRLREGELTRVIDLEGDRRFIRQIHVEARPARGNRSATLVLLGKSDMGRDDRRRPAPDLGRFTKIDTQRITRRDDDGVVEFDVGRDEGRLAELRLLAEDGDFLIREATILFGNGETQRARIGERLGENELSDIIDLQGEQRFVRKVRVTARLARGERSANLVLLGREDAGRRGYRGNRDRRDAAREEWLTLGTQRAALFKIDTDTFRVGRDKGTFRAIRAAVAKQEVTFYGMTIRYGDGEVEDVPLSGVIGPGEISKPYDLRGRDRFIDSITFKYRSKISLRGSGVIEIQGLKHGSYRGR